MAVGAGAALDAATLNATTGANATGAKVSLDNLLVIKQSLDAYSPEQMVSDDADGLGLDMTLEDAQKIKDGLAEVPAVSDLLNNSPALKALWGLGV